jgi:hypothetical protein
VPQRQEESSLAKIGVDKGRSAHHLATADCLIQRPLIPERP